jgi:hypothetical protein
MKTGTLLAITFAATVFAVAGLAPPTLSAQSPDIPVSVLVTSASGAERQLPGSDYNLGRAGLSPEQSVTVTLQFPRQQAGQKVIVSSLDGGALSLPEDDKSSDLFVREDGIAPFQFHAGHQPGLYRVIVRLGTALYHLEFYVVDLQNTARNPPRLQVVQ